MLNVVEERGLKVDLDRILLAFEDADTNHKAAAWVEEYLHQDTLLTREELELYVQQPIRPTVTNLSPATRR